MTTHTIKARPQPRGGWSLEVDGVGVSQVRRLEQAEDEMRAAVRDLMGTSADEVVFRLEVELPTEVRRRVSAVERDQAEAERLTRVAREERRNLVAHLNKDLHLPLRDVAAIMGLSYQRVSAMMKTPASETT